MTWSEFKTQVEELLPVDKNRANLTAFISRYLKLAVLDLQEFIPQYRTGHETIYSDEELQVDGYAMVGTLPEFSYPREFWVIDTSNHCNRKQALPYDWEMRNDLLCGSMACSNCNRMLALDPDSGRFIFYPALAATEQLILVWNGKKSDFSDDEYVPFPEEAVEACVAFIKGKISREVDRDLTMAESFNTTYALERTKLYIAAAERKQIKRYETSPTAGSDGCRTYAPTTASDVVFMVVGDTGSDSDITPTQDVAAMIRTSRPQFVIHSGDTCYPDAHLQYLQDRFIPHYSPFIQAENFYLSMGNHDLDANAGADVWNQIPYLADLNEGHKYYKIAKDNLDIFVLNYGRNTADEVVDADEDEKVTGPQYAWLAAEAAASTAAWKVVVVHASPYSSEELHGPGDVRWQIDWGAIGIDVVMSGHSHVYERLLIDGVQYVTCGCGGTSLRDFSDSIVSGSQKRVSGSYGAMKYSVSANRFTGHFIDSDGNQLDTFTLRK